MSKDLFASARDERLHERAPLAARLRPRTLDEVVGQEHLLGSGRPLRVPPPMSYTSRRNVTPNAISYSPPCLMLPATPTI